MSTHNLVDSDVRHRAETEVGTSFAMSAGAGTGKTTVLVRRLVEHLLAGTAPRQLAAITFTEKAAGELRLRARDALEARLVEARSDDERRRLEAILARFGELTLSTIHSFCQQLLEREALDAGWAPDTEVQEGSGGGAIKEAFKAWRTGFDTRHPESSILLREGGAADLPQQYQRTSLLATGQALLDNRDLTPILGEPTGMDWSQAWRELQELSDELDNALKQGRNPECKLVVKARQFVAEVHEAAWQPQAEQSVREALQLTARKLGGAGRAADWPGGSKKALVDAAVNFAAWQARWQRQIGVELHRVVVQDLVNYFVPAVEAAKRKSAQADFGDLLFRAAELLTTRHDARQRLADLYEVVLIDEVQDTDPIQAEVAMLLTRPSDASGPWNAVPPRPGSLFAVGDPKQSIYRFRRADVATWRELLAVIQLEGDRLSLRQNFRSVPGIVGWVNHAFKGYPDYEALVPHRATAALDPVVVVHTGAEKEDGKNTDGLIRHLSELRARGAQVYDPSLKALRPMRWADVMILLPSWTEAEAIQDDLNAARIDSVVEGGSKFFERDEVRLLLEAMRAIDEPQDNAAVVAVLRGLFGISHEELARFKKAGGAWITTLPDQPPGAIADAFRLLRHLNNQRSRVGWVPLLDDLLDQTRATCVFALTSRRWSILANIDKLKAMIYELELTARSPREVITALEQAREASTEDLSVLDTDLDAVRITSYFKAKGLEAPIVALVHTERQLKAPDVLVKRDTRQVGLRAGTEIVPPGWDALLEEEKEQLLFERRRWMYVATTRARDQLIFCHGTPPPPGAERDKWLAAGNNLVGEDVFPCMGPFHTAPHDTLHTLTEGVTVRLRQRGALPEVPRVTETFPGNDALVDAHLESPPTVGDPEGEARQQALREARKRAERGSSRWRAVGSLTGRGGSRSDHKGLGVGVEGGTVVHQVMEHLDLGRPVEELRPQVAGLVHAFATQKGLPKELEDKCVTIVHGLLNHEVIDQARSATERWREVPFTFPQGDTVVAGTIDLCFPVDAERTSWIVVDWKSHLPAEGDPLRVKYEKQLAWYVKAMLETVTPCKHVEPFLVGPHPALGLVEHLDEQLDEIHPSLHPLVLELAARGKAPSAFWEAQTGPDSYVELHVAWPDQHIGVGFDLPATDLAALTAFGWSVENADMGSATWPERVTEGVLERFKQHRKEDQT